MRWWEWALVTGGVVAVVWGLLLAALLAAGRGTDARALARFVPDCLVLVGRLLRDDRVPRRRKLLLVALGAYLASPIDLVPDIVPVLGQLDDALVAGLVLRAVLRSGGSALLTELWPGPDRSLQVVLRAAAVQ